MKSNNDSLKILVGGGAGYIGSALVPALVEHGYDVTVVDLCWFGSYLPEGVKLIKRDLFDCDRNDFKAFDQFVYLAGLSNDPMAEFSPSKNFIYNAALPSYLAFEAKMAGIKRFVYASSCSVYGYTVDELYDEKSPTVCNYPYGISKLQGEKGVLQFANEDFSVIALRKGTVNGHSARMRFDLIVNTMFKTAMTNGKITINNPSIWRPLCDMRDVVSAYARAIQASPSISGVFNIASGNFTVGQVGDIVRLELERLAGKKIGLEVKNITDFRNYKVSFENAGITLGFRPQYSINETVKNLYENRTSYGDFERDEYYNIRVFQKIAQRDVSMG